VVIGARGNRDLVRRGAGNGIPADRHLRSGWTQHPKSGRRGWRFRGVAGGRGRGRPWGRNDHDGRVSFRGCPETSHSDIPDSALLRRQVDSRECFRERVAHFHCTVKSFSHKKVCDIADPCRISSERDRISGWCNRARYITSVRRSSVVRVGKRSRRRGRRFLATREVRIGNDGSPDDKCPPPSGHAGNALLQHR
jgi:hypothetical protein